LPRENDHISQVKHNLEFLSNISTNTPNCVDWQVTCCFYCALHLVNAYLASKGLQYRKHVDVYDVINPYKAANVHKLPEDIFVSYKALDNLSRRSRYLVNPSDRSSFSSDRAHCTYSRHLAKAIRHLNAIMTHFEPMYDIEFDVYDICCDELKNDGSTKFFKSVAAIIK